MEDWTVYDPVDGQENDNQENDDNDGMFLADGDEDDKFITGPSHTPAYIEAQSFNPRFHNENLAVQNKFHYHPVRDDDQNDHFDQPAPNPVNYKDMSHSYTERKIHDAYFGPIKHRYQNKKYKNRKSRRRQHDASDTDFAIAAVTHELLESGFDQKRYKIFHDAAIHQRSALGMGRASEMNSLFYFWCYYLRDHFDEKMFNEFHELARQDAEARSHYGIECFFRFCSYGLEKRWDEKVFAIFQIEAIEDNKRGSLYGLEKVKGFLVHQKLGFPIEQFVTPEINKALEPFPTLESFKQRRADSFSKGKKPQNNSGQKNKQQQQPAKKQIKVEKRTIPLAPIKPHEENQPEPEKPKPEVTLPQNEDLSKIVFERNQNNDGENNK